MTGVYKCYKLYKSKLSYADINMLNKYATIKISWTNRYKHVGAKRYTGEPVNLGTDGHDTRIVSRVCVPVRTDTPNKYVV
jgi:hypothetical protein